MVVVAGKEGAVGAGAMDFAEGVVPEGVHADPAAAVGRE